MFTYTRDPTNTPRDAVRFLIGDTDGSDPQLDDSEIEYLLEQGGDAQNAAALAARAIAARYSRLVDKSVGDLSISYSQRAANYTDLATRLESQAIAAAPPFLGAIEVANTEARATDQSLAQPLFSVGSMDNVGG